VVGAIGQPCALAGSLWAAALALCPECGWVTTLVLAALRYVAPWAPAVPAEALAPVLAASCCGLMGLRSTRADRGT
jgi:hypothetical protein